MKYLRIIGIASFSVAIAQLAEFDASATFNAEAFQKRAKHKYGSPEANYAF